MAGPKLAVATIRYKLAGKERTWDVGSVLPDDNEATMREHLREWFPTAEFLGVTFELDAPPKAEPTPNPERA